jgi:hypothetical protein
VIDLESDAEMRSSTTMNSRERVRRAIGFQKPDRTPVSHAVLPASKELVKGLLRKT